MSEPFDAALALARADDPSVAVAAAAWIDMETRGELLVAVWQTGTPAARRAVAEALRTPFQRGTWQAFKRVWKLSEAARDAEGWVPLAAHLDRWRGATGAVSWRTLGYLRRRAYRHLKGLAHREPAAFRAYVERLLPLYGPEEEGLGLLGRLFRVARLQAFDPAELARFVPRLENPFLPAQADPAPPLELLDLDEAALQAGPAPAAPAPPASGARDQPAPPPWPGPIFPEVWLEDPAWAVDLLLATRCQLAARALARLLEERLGERALELPLGPLYRLLEHPAPQAWRWALAQLAARARRELLRFEELAALAARLCAPEVPTDWSVLGDLLWVLDDERAAEARQELLPALRDLLSRDPDAPGAGALADFLRRHAPPGRAGPLWSWGRALPLLGAARREVRELGGAAAARLADEEPLSAPQLRQLLASPWVEDDPQAVQRLLISPAAVPEGYRPPDRWPLAGLVPGLDAWPPAGFAAARRALLSLEEQGGLEAAVGLALARARTARTRTLGRELLAAALARGALSMLELAGLLAASGDEDVAVWAREQLAAAAAAGRLGNPAVYRLLEAVPLDVRGFARGLVVEHLRRFEAGELLAFCAESPDAATAELGLSLCEQELPALEEPASGAGRAHDLRAFLPMFRVLLYRVGRDRREKERLLATLERWALRERGNAALAVDVVAAFRRSQARLEFSRAVGLLAKIGRRWPDLPLPFTLRESFGAPRTVGTGTGTGTGTGERG